MAFGFKHGSKKITKYVAKPTVTGAFTFDNAKKACTISGYDAKAMTVSGTREATSSGTYTVTFTLNKGYAWSDKSKSAVSRTWSIAKRSITIPSLTNTSYTWATGTTFKPTINNVTADYVTQGGTTSTTSSGSFSVTWSLRFPNDTLWTDNTTAQKSGSWSVAKRSITVPSMSNTSHTWAVNTTFKPTISNVDSTYVTQSGTTSSTNVGSWTITWALAYPSHTQWSTGGTANKTASWSVNKLTLAVPSISSAKSFSFIEGTTRSVTVANFNSTYETQSGTTSTSALGSYTLTWGLRYPSNTQWSGGTTSNKTDSWSIVWTNGTSHYSNDVYNKGWGNDNIVARVSGSIVFNADNFYMLGNTQVAFRLSQLYTGKTFNATIKVEHTDSTRSVRVLDVKTDGSWGYTTAATITVNTNTYVNISTPHGSTSERYFGVLNTNTNIKYYFQRIWIT